MQKSFESREINMDLYGSYIFPWMLDFIMSRAVLSEQRAVVVPQAAGEVLEIGFGTGRNLPFYTEKVKRLVVVEPNARLNAKAAGRLEKSWIPVTALALDASSKLPLNGNAFDTVVSTWTLCSIEKVAAALEEISRVLRPGGNFIFVEHGLSPDFEVARWQNRLNEFEKKWAGGCNLNRNIPQILANSPLSIQHCDNFYLRRTPRIWGYTYRGMAVKEHC